MSRVVAASLVLLLAWSLLPGGIELVENATHLVMHGDFAHDQDKTDHAPFIPEHGCGGGFHLCSCCHSQQVDTPSHVAVYGPAVDPGAAFRTRRTSPGSGFPQAHKEPPRA